MKKIMLFLFACSLFLNSGCLHRDLDDDKWPINPGPELSIMDGKISLQEVPFAITLRY